MNQSLLSIVVPTKNRYGCLKKLIELFTFYSLPEIELVIQDNSDNNKELVEDFGNFENYPEIQYFYTPEHLSIGANSDLAILHSSGEYICFIGDDDGFTPYIRDAVLWMKSHNEKALVPADINYYWPEYHNSITGSLSASITYIPFKKDIKYIATKPMLKKIMGIGCTDRTGLPLVYHGIVKRSILDEIYKYGNTFFPGPSPDIANGVALSILLDRYVIMDLPIIIAGASQYQGGGARAMKNQAAELTTLPFLPKNTVCLWEKNIPKIWAAETIWAESAIKALRYMGKDDLINEINFEYLYARFIVFHYGLRGMAYKLSKHKLKLVLQVISLTLSRYYNGGIRLIKRKLFNISDNQIIIHNIPNINCAVQAFLKICPSFEIKK